MAKISPSSHEGDRNPDRKPLAELSSVAGVVGDGPPTFLESWKTELMEIASLAASIDLSLRRARDSMTGLLESVDEVASRAFDAERSLRDAESRLNAITNR